MSKKQDNEYPDETPETNALVRADAAKWDDDPPPQYCRMVALCRDMEAQRDKARRMREWDNRAISIARHYGYERDDVKFEYEDGRIRPALVLEKAVAVALDAWVDGNPVIIHCCPSEVEQWVALVAVAGQDVTGFSMDEMALLPCEPQELWMSTNVLKALDFIRKFPAKRESKDS